MAGNGLRRELQNRNFIQWCNTLGNTRRITKLPVGGYCSCLSLLSTRILSLVPYPTQKRIFPSHLRISLSFFLLSFVFSFLFIYSLPSPLSFSLSFSLPGSGRVVEISLFDYPLFDEVDRVPLIANA